MAVIKMVLAAAVMAVVSVASGDHLGQLDHLGHFITKRAVLLDDNFDPVAAATTPTAAGPRQPRDSVYPAPIPKGGYGRGRVGPVYTFVKTDYNGNFKWGVRHRAGAEYGGGYH